MKINKSLKFADFSYDEEAKLFTITDKDGNEVELNKVYSFAFMRFVIRISQRNWLRNPNKVKKNIDKDPEIMLPLDENEVNHPDQLTFKDISDEENMGIPCGL